MGKCITLGKYNNQYKYILLYLLFYILNYCIYDLNYYDMFEGIKFFTFKDNNYNNPEFMKFTFIRQIIIAYFGNFILSCISMIYNKIKIYRESKKTVKKGTPSFTGTSITLIHDENYENETKVISYFFVLIIIFCFVFQEQAIEQYNRTLCHLDFWFFELIIMAYLNKAILHIEIFKHQKFSFIFCIFPTLFKIMTVFLEKQDPFDYYPYEKDWYWFPIGLLIYFVLITVKAYAIIKIKWLMDLKYISANKLIMNYGLIGTVFYSIFSVISSLTDYSNYYIFINKNNTFDEYYKVFTVSNKTQIAIEIIVLICAMITSYIIKYNFMMVIKYLTPLHIVFLTPIFYFFSKVIILIYNVAYSLIHKNNFSNFFGVTLIPYCRLKFALDFSGDFFSFFGFLIYLEMIELNCLGLNYNLRNKISNRADQELMKMDDCLTSTEESINEEGNSINSDTTENIINMSNNSNFSY